MCKKGYLTTTIDSFRGLMGFLVRVQRIVSEEIAQQRRIGLERTTVGFHKTLSNITGTGLLIG